MIVHNCVLLNVPRPMKFTAFVDKLVEKNTSISSKHKDFKILLELARKRLFEQKYIYFEYHPKFSRKKFQSIWHFKYAKNVKKD